MANVNIRNIHDFITKKNLSKRGLSELMEISYSYLFRVLRGDRKAGGKFIDGLLKAGMSPGDIFLPNALPNGKDKMGV